MSQSFSFWLHDFSFMRSSYQISYQNNISLFWHHKTRPHAYLMLTEENSKINCCYKELYCAACAPPIYFSDINIYMSWYMTIFWHGIKANVLWEQTFLRVKWQFNRNPQINWTTHDVNQSSRLPFQRRITLLYIDLWRECNISSTGKRQKDTSSQISRAVPPTEQTTCESWKRHLITSLPWHHWHCLCFKEISTLKCLCCGWKGKANILK